MTAAVGRFRCVWHSNPVLKVIHRIQYQERFLRLSARLFFIASGRGFLPAGIRSRPCRLPLGVAFMEAATRSCRIRAMGSRDHPIAAQSPWQNGQVERLIGSIDGECLDTWCGSTRRSCGAFSRLTRLITIESGPISHWTRMRLIFEAAEAWRCRQHRDSEWPASSIRPGLDGVVSRRRESVMLYER